MGYRSQVMVLIYPDVDNQEDAQPLYDQLKLLMGSTFKHIDDDWGACTKWHDTAHAVQFHFDDVKWYDIYPEVQRFENMLDQFNGNDDEEGIDGYCVEFVRIGEDAEDIDERHYGSNNQYMLCVRREIDCNI
jgi:hypothetical protein